MSVLYLSFQTNTSVDFIAGSKIETLQPQPDKPYVLVQNRKPIGRFSRRMNEKITTLEQQGYTIADIEIDNVVAWYNEKTDEYLQQPLCKVVMEKN